MLIRIFSKVRGQLESRLIISEYVLRPLWCLGHTTLNQHSLHMNLYDSQPLESLEYLNTVLIKNTVLSVNSVLVLLLCYTEVGPTFHNSFPCRKCYGIIIENELFGLSLVLLPLAYHWLQWVGFVLKALLFGFNSKERHFVIAFVITSKYVAIHFDRTDLTVNTLRCSPLQPRK